MKAVLTSLFFAPILCLWAQPSIQTYTGVVNAASRAPLGLPNSAIAQGSVFIVSGAGLGPAAVAQASFPLPHSLAGTTVNITAGGTTLQAPVLNTVAGQIWAVMPSTTPVGPATLSVTYNGAKSMEYAFEVVASNFATFALSGQGNGPGLITGADYAMFMEKAAALPGDTAIIWGAGLGPISYDDSERPQGGNLTVPVQLYVGDRMVKPTYQGRSLCCAGVDQIAFQVPAGITGCYVPVEVSINGIVSPTTTMPIAASPDRVCSDPHGMPSSVVQELLSKPSFNIGAIFLQRTTQTGFPTSDVGSGYFHTVTPLEFAESTFYQTPALGTCIANAQSVDSIAFPLTPMPPLDAGPFLQIGAERLTKSDPGTYSTPGLPKPFLPPGAVTLSALGGADIGGFAVGVTDPAPLTWTNMTSGETINRASGFTVNWTGGAPGTFAVISGGVSLLYPSVEASFQCVAPSEQGSFTIPPNVLLQLPADSSNATGLNMYVGAAEPYTSFTVRGLDYGYVASVSSAYGWARLQ